MTQDIFTNKFYVYKITNKLNNKIYIGKTNNLERRWSEHIANATSNDDARIKRSPKLYNSIIKYGADQFVKEIIFQSENEKLVYEKEIEYIKTYNSINEGFNITLGGEGFLSSDKNPTTKLFAEDINDIIKLYCKDLLSTYNIAKLYNVHPTSISLILRKERIKNPKLIDDAEKSIKNKWSQNMLGEDNPSSKLSNNDRLKIVFLRKTTNLTINELAEKFHVGASTIKRVIKRTSI